MKNYTLQMASLDDGVPGDMFISGFPDYITKVELIIAVDTGANRRMKSRFTVLTERGTVTRYNTAYMLAYIFKYDKP
jgi:hypothetical protein